MHEFMYKVVVLHLVVAYVRTREFVAPYHSSAAAGYGLPRVADKQQLCFPDTAAAAPEFNTAEY